MSRLTIFFSKRPHLVLKLALLRDGSLRESQDLHWGPQLYSLLLFVCHRTWNCEKRGVEKERGRRKSEGQRNGKMGSTWCSPYPQLELTLTCCWASTTSIQVTDDRCHVVTGLVGNISGCQRVRHGFKDAGLGSKAIGFSFMQTSRVCLFCLSREGCGARCQYECGCKSCVD